MNIQETSQILRYISIAFPSYKPQYNEEQMKDALQLWAASFADVPGAIVYEAVRKYVHNDNEYAPSIGNIKTIINQMVGNEPISEGEAWNMVILAIRNGAYGADEEYAKLPEDVQEAIGGSHYLHELALSQDVNWGVESSNFFRNLRTARERRKNVENIPDRVKQVIDQMNTQKEAQLENKQEVARIEQKNYYDKLSERTMEKFLTEDRGELTEGQRGFADMLRERLGMPKKEEPSADEYSAEYYYDPLQDNKEDGWEGELFA